MEIAIFDATHLRTESHAKFRNFQQERYEERFPFRSECRAAECPFCQKGIVVPLNKPQLTKNNERHDVTTKPAQRGVDHMVAEKEKSKMNIKFPICGTQYEISDNAVGRRN